ncbi:tyrosine-type recombinase/integrase [Muricoccus pecuniae]|uniref:Integrase n=1 Tax=Muricoccus pecuniae TaxID=693023 RepID=A0A840YHZ3_9PROT|nr:integrase arm-type DNA-binding domain-containing protein [Roseomonas pecuniae]MBB5696107.1 integrase [Roseomonas pecuniae]
MATPIRFTKPLLTRLTCPAGKAEVFFWDDALPGFGVRAYASGRRLWIAQYRDGAGRTRRATLGDLRTVELDEARTAARQLLSKVELGADPQAERRAARKAVRVSALVEAYLTDAEGRLRLGTFEGVKRHLRVHAKPLHHAAASQLGRAEIVRVVSAVAKGSGPVAANRFRAALSAMWTWGLTTGFLDGRENPVALVPKPAAETPRERVLTDAELALVWHATEGVHDYGRVVRLLLLTGARREEVGGLAWGEIEGGVWMLPRARSKNGLPHEVPLGPLAMAQLPEKREGRDLVFGTGEGGFSGWSKCKAAMDVRIAAARAKAFAAAHGRVPKPDEVPPMVWTLHDLRRTFATGVSEKGIEPHIVEAVLNHASGAARRGVAGTYNRAAYREPKRAALALWEAHVREVVGLPARVAGNVAPMQRAS